MADKINIAIDGPSGAGKSTIAKAVAKALGIIYLDTGAMYRTVGLAALRRGIGTRDADAIIPMLDEINLEVVYENGSQKILLDGEDVTGKIRTPEVTRASSDVAVIPAVRLKLVELQRQIAKNNSVVMDGRDIGTYVLPNANYKFFLTASAKERARRRYLEMPEEQRGTLEGLEQAIVARDKNDSSRAFAPLKQAEDAVYLDTTSMSIEEVVEFVIKHCEG